MLALVGASDGALLLNTDAVGDAVLSMSSWALFTADRVDRVAEPPATGVDAAPDLAALRVLLTDAGVSDLALVSLATEASRAPARSSVLPAAPLEARLFASPSGVSGCSAVRSPDVFTGRFGNKGATAPGISRDSPLESFSWGPAASRRPRVWWCSRRVGVWGGMQDKGESVSRFLFLGASAGAGFQAALGPVVAGDLRCWATAVLPRPAIGWAPPGAPDAPPTPWPAPGVPPAGVSLARLFWPRSALFSLVFACDE